MTHQDADSATWEAIYERLAVRQAERAKAGPPVRLKAKPKSYYVPRPRTQGVARKTGPRKTHCIRGHERTPDTVTEDYRCRKCEVLRVREYRERQRKALDSTARD